MGVAQRCLKIVDCRLHTRNAHIQPRKEKSRKWGKKNNPLGNGEMYTGRQRNVQLYIYTNDGVWSAPVFFFATKGNNIQLVETWRAISSDSYFKSMDGMLTSEILRWLIDWSARATTSHFQEEEKRRNNREKGEYEGWISRVFISFKEAGSVLVQLHTWGMANGVIYSPSH